MTPVTNEVYLEVFEVVWHTVDETCFDPEFGELDWDRMRAAQRRDHDRSDRASIYGYRCVVVAPGE